ncbi:MAG: hypothetical protein R3F16_25165 [Myxococcota bacterium]
MLRGVLEQSADLREQLSDRVELVVGRRFTSRTAEIETDLTQRLEAARDADVGGPASSSWSASTTFGCAS